VTPHPRPLYDVLIAGAGPAGSACAARLAERGLSVALVERSEPGRSRVCGGFLGPEFGGWTRAWGWSGELDRLGKAPVRQVQVSGSSPRLVRAALPETGGYAVDRGVFDRWAADLAVRRGARLWTGTVVESAERDAPEAGGLWTARLRTVTNEADGSPRSAAGGADESAAQVIRARHRVDATGRRPAAAGKRQVFFACKAVYQGVTGLAGEVALHFIERGHVGLNPVSAGETTLCLCADGRYLREAHGDLDGMLRRFEAENPSLKRQLTAARRIGPWQTCQAEPDGAPVFYREGQFHIGDALSMVNPVIGGGIPIAMQSGVLLADLLVSQTEQTAGVSILAAEAEAARAFEHAWRKAFSVKFSFGRWLGAAERSSLASRAVMHTLGLAPALLGPLVRMSRPVPSAAGTAR
jgi:flavin-dependent dehydrogenase